MGPIMGTFLLELRHAVAVPFYLKESMGDLFTGVRVWGILGVQVRVCAKGQVLVLLLLGQ